MRTMAELMAKPLQVLRTVDMLTVALSEHLDRCDLAGLSLRVEYGTMLVCARALCWIACMPIPAESGAVASYRPMVQWLRDWGKQTFEGAAQRRGVRLDVAGLQRMTNAAAATATANIHDVLKHADL